MFGILCALLAGAFFFSAAARAEIAPPPALDVGGAELVLNGYGEREIMWTDVYRAGLYLPRRSSLPDYVRDPAVAKAIRIRILYKDLPDRMPAEWRETFEAELNRELLGRLKRAFRRLEQGDVLLFSFRPGGSTEIAVNGEVLLTDPGHDLMLALIDQWMGDRPVSKNLRRLLLRLMD